MNRLYITGDTHGERGRWRNPEYGIEGRLGEGDTIIVCGDFKYIFDNEQREAEEAFLDELSEKPYQILFCDGNHENFPRLYAYPEETWNGGRVHRVRKNILHLMRGQVFKIGGKSIFVMGGGHSFGDNPPLIAGKTWWEEETPSAEEYREAKRSLERCNYKVDIILTHTAPFETMHLAAPEYEADELNHFLDWIRKHVSYRRWYMGHLHMDQDLWDRQTVLWHEVREICC